MVRRNLDANHNSDLHLVVVMNPKSSGHGGEKQHHPKWDKKEKDEGSTTESRLKQPPPPSFWQKTEVTKKLKYHFGQWYSSLCKFHHQNYDEMNLPLLHRPCLWYCRICNDIKAFHTQVLQGLHTTSALPVSRDHASEWCVCFDGRTTVTRLRDLPAQPKTTSVRPSDEILHCAATFKKSNIFQWTVVSNLRWEKCRDWDGGVTLQVTKSA